MSMDEYNYDTGGSIYTNPNVNRYYVNAGLNPAPFYGLGSYTYDFDAVAKSANIRYGRSYMDFDDLISYFDVARLPDYDGIAMPYIGHIIFTRPSLHLTTGLGSPPMAANGSQTYGAANFAAMKTNPLSAGWVNDYYGKRLAHMLSDCNPSAYMPMFTTRGMSYSVNDVSLKTVEKSQTYFGHVIKYGKHSEEHKIGGTITIDFRNDYYHSIIKAIWIWMSYIMIASKTDAIKPSDRSQKNAILDYCGSIYYLVTRMDSTTLVYWEKLTGVFPKSLPFSVFSYDDAPWTVDKLSVEFDYAVRSDPNDPNVLFDLNVLSSQSYEGARNAALFGVTGQQRMTFDDNNAWRTRFMVRPDSFESPMGLGNAFAGYPIVKFQRNSDGTITYYLQYSWYEL